jgi:hypothetical protein
VDDFLRNIRRWGRDEMIKERVWQCCQYIALYDEELSDESGLREEEERCRRASSLLVAALHLVPWFHIL